MSATQMDVFLLAHTQLSGKFAKRLYEAGGWGQQWGDDKTSVTDGQLVALTAIRTCYSALDPKVIVITEGSKYFDQPAKDGPGTDADRLFRQIFSSGHTSTVEHLCFTFVVTGVSRALLAQLTRHRHMSYSVQSQRYVKLGSGDRSGGFDYVVPDKIAANPEAKLVFDFQMMDLQQTYDRLRELGIPSEDARSVLPNAAATNLVLTANVRALLDFYAKRRPGHGAQHEITQLAEAIRSEVVSVEPWLDEFFNRK